MKNIVFEKFKRAVVESAVKRIDKEIIQPGKKKEHERRNIVQTRNPKSNRYVKLDRNKGKIIATKLSPGPYKNIPICRKSKER